MRREAEQWMKQAEYDFDAAKKNLKIGLYNVAAFLSQQTAEKALKAVYISTRNDFPPQTHNILDLARDLKAQELLKDLLELNPHYVQARYPDAANAVPTEAYSEITAEKCVKLAGKVLFWCRQKAN